MGQKTEDLDDVYGATTPEESRAAYNSWARDYEADCLGKGFWLPFMAAAMYARHTGVAGGDVLDAGCGTGLLGRALSMLGYGPVTGCDLSPEMLSLADETGAYAHLVEANMGEGLPFDDAAFGGFTCSGSFGPGHAPPETLRHLARVTCTGGIGVFNLVDATCEEQGFPAMIAALEKEGIWRVEEQSPVHRAFLLAEPDVLVRLYAVRIL